MHGHLSALGHVWWGCVCSVCVRLGVHTWMWGMFVYRHEEGAGVCQSICGCRTYMFSPKKKKVNM